jgi:probable HAF family extracellular repeat protein
MNRRFRTFSVLWFAVVFAASTAAQTFTTIDYPGAVATQARAINAPGDILGTWQDANQNWHGFLLSRGVFVGFDCQGAISTRPNKMNSQGEAVGNYMDAAGKFRGFYLHMALPSSWEEAGARCVAIEPKGSMGKSINTGALGISEAGDIVGQFDDSEGNFHGVLSRGGVHFIFDLVDGPWNGALAITPQGELLGHMRATGDRMKGWWLTRGGLRLIEFPPAESNSMSCPVGVNSKGEVVGHYQRTGDQVRGFLYSNGNYVSIEAPDATYTEARGINDDGVIVGLYTDKNSKTHGFVMRRP